MYGASGNSSFSSGTSGPFGPSSKLVVRIVGSLKYLARSASASTLFLNSSGEKSPHELTQAGLVVDKQDGGVVLVEAGIGLGHCQGILADG